MHRVLWLVAAWECWSVKGYRQSLPTGYYYCQKVLAAAIGDALCSVDCMLIKILCTCILSISACSLLEHSSYRASLSFHSSS